MRFFKGHTMTTEQIKLAQYVADYIQEELGRGVSPNDIGAWLICDAFEAYAGGAAEIEETA
jgi:hypothetical protein